MQVSRIFLPLAYRVIHVDKIEIDCFFLESSLVEIERILLLLLACSVSGGDRKDIHIQQLARLNESTQQSLMPYIEELTNDINTILQPQEYFFTDGLNTDVDQRLKCLFSNLIRLIDERDHYFEEILELEQDKESLKQKLDLYQSSSSNLLITTTSNLRPTTSQTSLNTFLNELETKNPGIEITEYKTKMRQMKSDLYARNLSFLSRFFLPFLAEMIKWIPLKACAMNSNFSKVNTRV